MRSIIKIRYIILTIFLLLFLRTCYIAKSINIVRKKILNNPNVSELTLILQDPDDLNCFLINIITKDNTKIILEDVSLKFGSLTFRGIRRIGDYGTMRELYYLSGKYSYTWASYNNGASELLKEIYNSRSVNTLLENITEIKDMLSQYPLVDEKFHDLLIAKPDIAVKQINPSFDKTKCTDGYYYIVGYFIEPANEDYWN